MAPIDTTQQDGSYWYNTTGWLLLIQHNRMAPI